MRILIFSIGPVFPEHVHGGSQRILREVAIYLGKKGHKVTILCPRRLDNYRPFVLVSGVQVLPILRLKPTYPEPYYTAPFNIANLIVQVKQHLEHSDVFYIHDGELPFDFLYQDHPTVVSFRDFVYPDTLVGGFGFRRDLLVLSSEYLAQCVIDAFSSFRPGVVNRIKVIPNGIDLSHFKNHSTNSLIEKYLQLPEGAITLLYPHRPDPRKGIFEAISVTSILSRRLGVRRDRLRLLVPLARQPSGSRK